MVGMIQSRPLGLGGFAPQTTLLTRISDVRRPHRLVAQDGALSRLKQGFESPWGHPFPRNRQHMMLSGFVSLKIFFKKETEYFEALCRSRSEEN